MTTANTIAFPTTLSADCSYPYGECRKEWAMSLDGELVYRTTKVGVTSPWLLADIDEVRLDHPELDTSSLPRVDVDDQSVEINPRALDEDEQQRFVAGWESAGGMMDDIEASAPWCCPWCYTDSITVTGDTPEEWGASWWEQCKEEIETAQAVDEDA